MAMPRTAQINLPKHLCRADRNYKPSRNTERHFTPIDIAHEMVCLADIRLTDPLLAGYAGAERQGILRNVEGILKLVLHPPEG